jgi:hypothetical protein
MSSEKLPEIDRKIISILTDALILDMQEFKEKENGYWKNPTNTDAQETKAEENKIDDEEVIKKIMIAIKEKKIMRKKYKLSLLLKKILKISMKIMITIKELTQNT